MGQNVNRIEEIDRSPQKAEGTQISASGKAGTATTPDAKRQRQHKDAAGVQRQHAANLQGDPLSTHAFPQDLSRLQDDGADPDDQQCATDLPLVPPLTKQDGKKDHEQQQDCRNTPVQRREQSAGDLISRRQKILMRKEIPKQKKQGVHAFSSLPENRAEWHNFELTPSF
jgi:hypothetical protein